jgi:hypothetical protein
MIKNKDQKPVDIYCIFTFIMNPDVEELFSLIFMTLNICGGVKKKIYYKI